MTAYDDDFVKTASGKLLIKDHSGGEWDGEYFEVGHEFRKAVLDKLRAVNGIEARAGLAYPNLYGLFGVHHMGGWRIRYIEWGNDDPKDTATHAEMAEAKACGIVDTDYGMGMLPPHFYARTPEARLIEALVYKLREHDQLPPEETKDALLAILS